MPSWPPMAGQELHLVGLSIRSELQNGCYIQAASSNRAATGLQLRLGNFFGGGWVGVGVQLLVDMSSWAGIHSLW